MRRRLFSLPALMTLVFALIGMKSQAQSQGPARKMNVLFIAVDDLNTALGNLWTSAGQIAQYRSAGPAGRSLRPRLLPVSAV